VVITRNGKPIAVILSTAELESLKETLEIQSDPEFMKEIRKGLKAHQEGKVLKLDSLDELFGPAE
jgi:antitoxin YefM